MHANKLSLFLKLPKGKLLPYSRLVGINDKYVNMHLITGPIKGKTKFCFSETLNFSRGKAEGNIEVERKQNTLFSAGPVIKCPFYTS